MTPGRKLRHPVRVGRNSAGGSAIPGRWPPRHFHGMNSGGVPSPGALHGGGSPFGHPPYRRPRGNSVELAPLPDKPSLSHAGRNLLLHDQSPRKRQSDLLTRHIDALCGAVRRTRRQRRFRIDVWVVLPDHMHCVITLPQGDDDFSNRFKASRSASPTPFRRRLRLAIVLHLGSKEGPGNTGLTNHAYRSS